MFLYEVIGENNFTNNTPRLHSVRDANIFEILAKDIENGIFKYSTTQSKKNCISRKQEENPIFTNIMFLNTINHPILSPPTYTRMVSVTSTQILPKKGL